MQGQDNYLGIYLSKDRATVLCLSSQAQDVKLLGCFSVSLEEPQQANPNLLAELIARGCEERQLQFSEAVVALDCAMFMQHKLHSDFSDQKQIASTIRFDTEEALATDISEAAIAFGIAATDQTGSSLDVFTAQRKALSDILAALQANNIDPMSIEPDINCLSRFVRRNISAAVSQEAKTFYGMLSGRNGYFILFSAARKQLAARTFLLGSQQNRTELLAREVPLTAGLVGGDGPIERVRVFDSLDSVDCRQLGDRLGFQTDGLDLAEAAGADTDSLGDCDDLVDFAICYGAALGCLEKQPSMNFRNDFLPYQGKKRRLEKTIKQLSVSAVVVMLAVGVYFQSRLLQKNRDISRLNEKLAGQYSVVMLGKKVPARSSVSNKLAGELRRIKAVKSGQLSITGEESASSKLTLVLEAFNKCASKTDLNIETISITSRNINIVGDTSSRVNTLKLFEALKGVNLDVEQQRLDSKGGRDTFSITVVPKSG